MIQIPGNSTKEQVISYALYYGTKDYLDELDYDAIDWREWTNINRN